MTPRPYLIQINLVLLGDWTLHNLGINNSETATQDCLHRSLTTSLLYFKDSPSSLFWIASNIIYLPSFPRASTASHPPVHYLPFLFQLTPPLCCLLVEIPGKTFVVLDFMLLLRRGADYEHAAELSSSSSVCRQTGFLCPLSLARLNPIWSVTTSLSTAPPC